MVCTLFNSEKPSFGFRSEIGICARLSGRILAGLDELIPCGVRNSRNRAHGAVLEPRTHGRTDYWEMSVCIYSTTVHTNQDICMYTHSSLAPSIGFAVLLMLTRVRGTDTL